ncbi:efflux RND transporter permease subunit [Marinobacterium rhizophilum]|uniref:Efflux RND transporter permease subunit n=1 Tax=Marinobacterium rhizophilum TaxID=420402 RepID=A0ABY5HJJ6_9GAMM|nr:efflux RND transporter permease subunit [Marinobacterium rhizophilum]UTW12555.1 efflux RND transporter permease subunit [Marinobacterium rhizophilum]
MRRLLQNGRLLTLLVAVLVVAGIGALATLPRTEDPRILNRQAIVITHLPGASAERVEAQVSEKIENELRTLAQIKHLTSTSRPGISMVKIELKDSVTATTAIWSRTRDLLADVIPRLPPGASKPELDDDRGYAFTSLIALKWHADTEPDLATLGRYGKSLTDRMRALPGTDFVELYGEQDEEILVQIDPHLASNLHLTPGQIARRIESADAKVSAGQLDNAHNQLQVELEGALDSLDRIRQIPLLSDANGYLLRLGDLAEVRRSLKWPEQELAIIDGEAAVVVAVRMLPDLRIDRWSASLRHELAQFSQQLPGNVEAEILFDQNHYTERRLGELVNNILLGFSLIALVLLITLGWRSALIVTLSLPLTVLFTLTVMKYYGLPIHQMSVTGLVVALGIMVDNAIVMADTIAQRRRQGLSAIDAVIRSLRHLWLPLLGSTLTTILAFMPIVLMPGPAGEFVGGIALSVIFALIGSYLVSHSVVAVLAGRFLRVGEGTQSGWYQQGIQLDGLARLFRRSLETVLRFPKLAIALLFLVPLAGFISAGQLKEQFFPPSDRDMFQIEMYLPAQTSIVETRRVSDQVSALLHATPGIDSVQWFLGNSAPAFYYNLIGGQQGSPYFGQAMVSTHDFRIANRLIPQLQRQLDDLLPQAQILVRKLEQGPPFNAPIELRLYGPNLDQLQALGEQARALLSRTRDVIHSRATLQPGTPKVRVRVDEEAGQISGFTLQGLAAELQSSLSGVTGGTVLESTESVPVRVRIGNEARRELQDLANLSLTSAGASGNIPLSALARLELEPSRGAIPRRDGQRVNVVEGYLRAGVLASVALAEFRRNLEQADFHLPAGYRMEFGGESAGRNDAVGNLMASLGVIVTLLITVVVLSFNSFRISALIFLAALQSAGLGLLSVYLFGYPFGFTVIIGLLGLMGLAINAAIVILAELKADARAVRGDPGAIVHAVQCCSRHIGSTTITTVGGFLPLILAGGGFWPPFAVAIAGGTVLTTLLSFYFVPAAFMLLARRKAFDVAGGEPQQVPVDGRSLQTLEIPR